MLCVCVCFFIYEKNIAIKIKSSIVAIARIERCGFKATEKFARITTKNMLRTAYNTQMPPTNKKVGRRSIGASTTQPDF